MLYRKMPKCDRELSILGFGCMRFPLTKEGHVDEAKAIELVRYAIDHGVNYVDTAWPYHDGESETVLGKALQDGYREQVNLATKLPTWLVNSGEDMDKYLVEQLKRLQTDHIDFYLIHTLDREKWDKMQSIGFDRFLDSAVKDGRVTYPGFSFHGELDTFISVVDGYDWTMALMQYNYLDEQLQAGTEGLRYAAKKNLGIVVMEPLRGGAMALKIPDAEPLWAEAGKGTPAEWGLRWVWDHPEVTVVLSGMSRMSQVRENLRSASKGLPSSLTPAQLKAIHDVRDLLRNRMKVNCTGCRYCMPCPNGVAIPDCFMFYNNAFMYDKPRRTKQSYEFFLGDTEYASRCIKCGECLDKCPQAVKIPEMLKEVAGYFGR
jgi:predicted aldo/keto reductase-like oxidoreductase